MNISVEEVESAEMLSEKLRMRTETKKSRKIKNSMKNSSRRLYKKS